VPLAASGRGDDESEHYLAANEHESDRPGERWLTR
jgi:hypothetical protein